MEAREKTLIEVATELGAEIIQCNDLQYTDEVGDGPWRCYIYDADGYHSGGKWFRKHAPLHPAEEISKEEAYQNVVAANLLGREARVVDGGDFLVFHARDGQILHGAEFWVKLGFDLRKMAANTERVQIAATAQAGDGLCIFCNLPALPRCKTEAGRREFGISKICEVCYDTTFGGDDEK